MQKPKFEETSRIAEDTEAAAASCSSPLRRCSDCARSTAAAALLLVHALIAHVLPPRQLSSPSTLCLRTFCSRLNSPPRQRSESARPTAAAALLPVDALIAHVWQPSQLSSSSTLWLRTFCSRMSSYPLLDFACHVWIQSSIWHSKQILIHFWCIPPEFLLSVRIWPTCRKYLPKVK